MKLEVEVDNDEEGRDAVGLYLATLVYKQTRMRARHWYTVCRLSLSYDSESDLQ